MKTFKVTVCQFGHAIVTADSEEDAKEKVGRFTTEQIQWMGDENTSSPFLVTYAEVQKE